MRTPLDERGVINFFLGDYEPTPVLAPWNGGSGFYDNDNKAAIEAIRNGNSPRFALYRQCLELADEALTGFSREESAKGEDKSRLLTIVRSQLPETALDWFDASVLLAGSSPPYPPLLGTGGNDGRLDFTNNYMQRLGEVLSFDDQPRAPISSEWLETALFAAAAPNMVKKKIGQFSPGQAGGPNACAAKRAHWRR